MIYGLRRPENRIPVSPGLIFSGHGHEEENEEQEDSDLFSSLYDDFRESAPMTETDGTIVFGIDHGQWTLLSMDEELLYSYYGLSALAE